MKKNFINHIYSAAILLSLGLVACSDDKDLGTIGSEKIIISSVELAKTDFEVKDGSICLVYGQSIEIKCKVSPENASNQELIWSSSNEKVATVSQTGVITAGQTEGEAIIYVAPVIGFGPSAATPSRKIKVIEKAILVETLSLKSDNPEDVETGNVVLAGDVRQLLVTANPEDHTYEKYTWISSDPTVATVNESGLVETIAPGDVTITLTSRDGGEATANYSFTVKPSVIPTAVEFVNTEKLANLAYGESIDLKNYIKLTPEDATFALIKWSSNKDDLISVNNRGILKVNFDTDPAKVIMINNNIKLSASTPDGSNLGNIMLTVNGGNFIHNFKSGMSPFVFLDADKQPGMSYQVNNTHIHVELGTKNNTDYRQDFKVANTKTVGKFMLSTAKYKYFAVKMRRPYYYNEATSKYEKYPAGTSSAKNKIALNLTPKNRGDNNAYNQGHYLDFKQLDINNTQLINERWDGQSKVYVWEIDKSKINGATDSANGLVDMEYIDLIIADVPAANECSYDIYWIGTFSSLEEIKVYYEANE